MQKDFDGWNDHKKHIHFNSENKFYHPRDIWWCTLGLNVAFEQDGKDVDFQRPILIIKALGDKTCIVLPLTTSPKNHKYRIDLGEVDGKLAKAVLSQVKVIDTKRLINKVAVLSEDKFEVIRKAVRDLF